VLEPRRCATRECLVRPNGPALGRDSEEGAARPEGAHRWSLLGKLDPDGSRLASAGNEGNVLVWDASTGGRITSLRAHPTGASAVCWSPDGRRLATASHDYTVQIHDAGPGFTAARQAASSASGKGH